MSETEELRKAREAERKILKGRFCSSCRQVKSAQFGELISSRKKAGSRWRCFNCSVNAKKKQVPKKG